MNGGPQNYTGRIQSANATPLSIQKPDKALLKPRHLITSNLALPDSKDLPTKSLELTNLLFVALFVSVQFFRPKRAIGLWTETPAARMPVPKATVYEYDLVARRKHQIRPPR